MARPLETPISYANEIRSIERIGRYLATDPRVKSEDKQKVADAVATLVTIMVHTRRVL